MIKFLLIACVAAESTTVAPSTTTTGTTSVGSTAAPESLCDQLRDWIKNIKMSGSEVSNPATPLNQKACLKMNTEQINEQLEGNVIDSTHQNCNAQYFNVAQTGWRGQTPPGWYESTGTATLYDVTMTTCAVSVMDKEDIKHTLQFIRDYNAKNSKPIRTVIKNTGHDWTARSADVLLHDEEKDAGSIMIHTNMMNGFKMLEDGESIRMEAGVTFYPVYKFLHGLQPPRLLIGGGCPNVGAAGGFTLGGGYSWWSKKFGPMADHATEFEGVLADGTEFKANEKENPDLFFALRGGGFGMGVVTAVIAKTVPLFKNLTDFTNGKWSCDSRSSFKALLEKYWKWWVAAGDHQQNVGRATTFSKTSNAGKNNDGEYEFDFTGGVLFDLPQEDINNLAAGLMTLGKGIDGCKLDQKVKQRNDIDYMDLLYDLGTTKEPIFQNAGKKKHGSYNYALSSVYLKMDELKDIPKFSEKLMKILHSINADSGIAADFELNMGNLYGNPNSPKKVNSHPTHSMNTAHDEAFGVLHVLKEIPYLYADKDTKGKRIPLVAPQLQHLQSSLPKGVVPDECVKSSITVEERQKCTDDIWEKVTKFGKEYHDGARKVLHDQFPNAGTYSSLADYDLKNGLTNEIDFKTFFWGGNYSRLLAIKKKVDPTNMLTCHHCVGAEFPRNKPFPSDTLLV